MYSIHGTVKDEAPSPLVEEQPADMMCMFNGISSMDDSPKWDQYDDDHEAEMVDCLEKPAACHWQEEDHLPFKCDNHPLHNSYDNDGQCAENLK
jgi:predicted PolB exonuclease-like 3'-5' exonuclease